MNGLLGSLLEKLPPTGRRVVVVMLVCGALGAVWAVAQWASQPMYVALYSDLDYAQAAELEEALKEGGVPTKLGGGGSQVMVPVSETAHARVVLARAGHTPGDRPGLELFDKPAWGMTDFSQRVTFQRALEGELARTVAGIKGVEKAQIHLALPAQSALRRLQKPASASVVLSLTPGTTLSPETISGITYIVSNSVDLLDSDHVAVMGDDGKVFTIPAGSEKEASAGSKQLEMQRSTEELLVHKILELLEPVVGIGHVRAEVAAELNFDKVDRTKETYDPSAGNPADGALPFNAREYERNSESVGKLMRLSAAVLLDQAAYDAADTSGATLPSAAEVEGMVRAAIGIDEQRGDVLSLLTVTFEKPEPLDVGTESAGGTDIMSLVERMIRPAIGLVGIIFLSLVGLKVLRMAPAPPAAPQATPAAPEATGTTAPGSPAPDTLQVVRGWLKDA